MRIGIAASNIGGGGGLTHLKEILENYDYKYFDRKINKIIVFSSTSILESLPENSIIEKITFPEFNSSLLNRVIFQLTKYDKEIASRCDLLFSIAGDYVGSFKPVISMSRNMLLYERQIWKEIKVNNVFVL